MTSRPFSSVYYDTVRQRKAWWADPSIENRERQRKAMRARLRFDFLFSEVIALSRADILDGACFMHTSPDEIRKWLALDDDAPSPIVVYTRTGSLEADLLDWVRVEQTGKLSAEPFFVMPPSALPAFFEQFPKLPAGTVKTWKDLPSAIATAIESKDIAEELDLYWSSWITQSPKKLKILPFNPNVPYKENVNVEFDKKSFDSYGLDPQSFEGKAITAHYSKAVQVFSDSGWSRGALTKWLDETSPNLDLLVAGAVQHELDVGICRARAIADGTDHETISALPIKEDWLRRFALRLLTDGPDAAVESNLVDLEIPIDFAEWLVHCEYEDLIQHVRALRRSWLLNNSMDALKRLAEGVANFVVKNPSRVPMAASQRMVGIIRAATVTATLTTAIRIIQAPPDGFLDGIVPAVLGAVGTITAEPGLDNIVRGLYQKELVHQLVQSIRRR